MAHSSLDFYFYNTGYLRTSSAEYSVEELVCSDMQHYDRFLEQKEGDEVKAADTTQIAHLTNNTLQKTNKDTFGLHEEGNVASFEDF